MLYSSTLIFDYIVYKFILHVYLVTPCTIVVSRVFYSSNTTLIVVLLFISCMLCIVLHFTLF